ncbi:MAG: ATPase [bacterium]|nr:ATPase [bacterium]
MSAEKFRFTRNDNIGSNSAELDSYLDECFVDAGYIDALRDMRDHRRILLGRTGSGKSALLRVLLSRQERTIEVSPDSLSMSYISNSDIMTLLKGMNVHFDLFFKLLWRHVLVVEVLKRHFELTSDSAQKGWFQRTTERFTGKKEETDVNEAINFLREYGDTFWQETDYRLKEVTQTVESELLAVVNAIIPDFLKLGIRATEVLSTEETMDVKRKCQEVINKAHLKKLDKALQLLDRVIDDDQKKYYVVIDGLDENWVDDAFRYKLIRALIETAREFCAIRHVKVIIALREDLYWKVLEETSDPGLQAEKYESLVLPVFWTERDILEMLDLRPSFDSP